MDHKNYKDYTLQQLYEALETVDEVNYPGQLDAIETRIDELEGNSTNDLEGIGGWLILIAIGIIITPIRIIMMLSTYPELFTTGAWEALTTQGGEAYNPFLAPMIIMEIIVNCVLVLAWVYMGYRFFTRRSDFPKWYIGIAIFSLFFILADAFLVNQIMPNQPVFDPDTIKETIRALIMVMIWVPYMLVSKRVKATFVH